jgi:hypothetical protein
MNTLLCSVRILENVSSHNHIRETEVNGGHVYVENVLAWQSLLYKFDVALLVEEVPWKLVLMKSSVDALMNKTILCGHIHIKMFGIYLHLNSSVISYSSSSVY